MKDTYFLCLDKIGYGEETNNSIGLLKIINASQLYEPIIKVFEYMLDSPEEPNNMKYDYEEKREEKRLAEELREIYQYVQEGKGGGWECKKLGLFFPERDMKLYGKNDSEWVRIENPKTDKLVDYPSIIKQHNEEYGQYNLIELLVEFIINTG